MHLFKNCKPHFLIKFHDVDNDNKEIGKFYVEDDILKFEGNTDESAKIFVETVCGVYNKTAEIT